jgi:hypothetical protein
LLEPKPPLLGLPTTLQKVASISSMQITSVVGPCDEDGDDDCPSVWADGLAPCATAGEVNATKATVNGINLIASQRPFSGKVRSIRRRGGGFAFAYKSSLERGRPDGDGSRSYLGALVLLGKRVARGSADRAEVH